MIWSQPLTEAIMMAVSIVLMLKVIKMSDVEE